MHDANLQRMTFCTILLLLAASQIHARWYLAPASPEGGIEEIAELDFMPLYENRNIDLLIYTKQQETGGWVWLKKDLLPEGYSNHILVRGTYADWSLWINSDFLGTYKPVSLPIIHDISRFGDKKVSVYLKTFFRRGHARAPDLPEVGDFNQLQRKLFLYLLGGPFNYLVSILIGLILIICIVGTKKPDKGLGSMALFGLFLITSNVGKLGLLSGWRELWLIPTLITSCSLPLATSFWRRMITDSPDNRIRWINAIDSVFILLILTRIFLIQTGIFETPFLLNYDPLPAYVLMSVIVALELWFYGLAMRWKSRFATALIMFSAILITVLSLSSGHSLFDSTDNLILYGFPLSGLLCIMILARTSLATPPKDNEEGKYPESIAERIDSSPSEAFQSQTLTDTPDQIDRAIRLSFRNRKIPWDSYWDVAVTNQINHSSAPDFHDFYISADERIHGFSFFSAKQNNTESTVFTQIVRSHLHRHFLAEASLIQLARGVSHASNISARTLKAHMEGLVASLDKNFMSILPVGKPKALLRRSSNGQIIPIVPIEQPPFNPEIGSTYFGKEGIKTFKIPFFANDVLLVYSPDIESSRTHTGAKIGYEGLTRLLQTSRGVSAKEIFSGITKAISQSTPNMPPGSRILIVRNKQGMVRA